jgi:hypothetical protein
MQVDAMPLCTSAWKAGALDAVQQGGWDGLTNYASNNLPAIWKVLTDPQVDSALMLGGLALLGLIAAVAVPIVGAVAGGIIVGTTVTQGIAIDQAIAAAASKAEAIRTATSQNTRAFVVGSALILALVALGGVSKASEFTSFQKGMSLSAQAAFDGLPFLERIKLFDTANAMKISPEALDFYLTESARPGSSLAGLSLKNALQLSNLADKAGISGAVLDSLLQSGEIIKVDPALATEFAQVVSKATGENVWVSTKNGAVYLSESTELGVAAARQLATDAPLGRNVDGLIEVIARESMRGGGDRLVLGAWEKGGGYIENSLDNSGVFFDTGGEVWGLVEQSGIQPWRINQQVLQLAVKDKIPRIDFVGQDIFDVINNPNPTISGSFRAQEINWLLANAESYGYTRVGNSWILVRP